MIALSATLVTAPAWAAEQPLPDDQLSLIRQNCKQAQSILQRLQATDVATRINRGRIYDNLLSKLITPFNSRVTSNNYNAVDLTTAAGDINHKFSDFKTDYSSYEDSFSSLLSKDCEADPQGFYDLLQTTREARGRVATDIADLNIDVSHYTDSFTALRTSIGN